jgi:hypothetical protein
VIYAVTKPKRGLIIFHPLRDLILIINPFYFIRDWKINIRPNFLLSLKFDGINPKSTQVDKQCVTALGSVVVNGLPPHYPEENPAGIIREFVKKTSRCARTDLRSRMLLRSAIPEVGSATVRASMKRAGACYERY